MYEQNTKYSLEQHKFAHTVAHTFVIVYTYGKFGIKFKIYFLICVHSTHNWILAIGVLQISYMFNMIATGMEF